MRLRPLRKNLPPRNRWWAHVHPDCTVYVRCIRLSGRHETHRVRGCPVTLECVRWPEDAPQWLLDEVRDQLRELSRQMCVVEVQA